MNKIGSISSFSIFYQAQSSLRAYQTKVLVIVCMAMMVIAVLAPLFRNLNRHPFKAAPIQLPEAPPAFASSSKLIEPSKTKEPVFAEPRSHEAVGFELPPSNILFDEEISEDKAKMQESQIGEMPQEIPFAIPTTQEIVVEWQMDDYEGVEKICEEARAFGYDWGNISSKRIGAGELSISKADDGGLQKLSEILAKLHIPLRELQLMNAFNLTDEGMKFLPQTLKKLTIQNCPDITNTGFVHFPPTLEELCIEGSNTVDEGIIPLLPRTLVKFYLFAFCIISGEALRSLPSNLVSLALNNCGLRSLGSNCLAETIEELDLSKSSCKRIEDQEFVWMPLGLKRLTLDGSYWLTDLIMKKLPKGLIELSINSCNRITDEGLRDLAPFLVRLNLFGCKQVTDKGIQYLSRNLEKLNVEGCSKISCEGWKNIFFNLKELNLTDCYKVTDAGVESLPDTITLLTFGNNYEITDVCLSHLASMKALQRLTLYSCMNITQAAVNQLHAALPNTKIFFILWEDLDRQRKFR